MNMPDSHSHQSWPICSNDQWRRERIAVSCETLNFRSCNGWFLGEQHVEWPFKTWRNPFSHGHARIPRTPTFIHLFTTINDMSKGLRTGYLGETISSGISSQIFHLWEGGILGSENVNETICCQFSCDAFCHFFARFPAFIPKKMYSKHCGSRAESNHLGWKQNWQQWAPLGPFQSSILWLECKAHKTSLG
jgi:hypothetical protein